MKSQAWIFAISTIPMTCAAGTAAEPAMAASASEAQIIELQAQLQRLLTRLNQQIASLPANDPSRREKADQVAAIEKKLRDGSRVHYVSPLTQGSWKAYDAIVSRRVEQQGEKHFPTVNGRRIYGRLIVNLTIYSDGHIVGAKVIHGSGNPVLDQLATRIALDAGPFPPFDEAMRKDADQVVITAPFNFHHQD